MAYERLKASIPTEEEQIRRGFWRSYVLFPAIDEGHSEVKLFLVAPVFTAIGQMGWIRVVSFATPCPKFLLTSVINIAKVDRNWGRVRLRLGYGKARP